MAIFINMITQKWPRIMHKFADFTSTGFCRVFDPGVFDTTNIYTSFQLVVALLEYTFMKTCSSVSR